MKRTLKFKKENCDKCAHGNKAAMLRGESGCKKMVNGQYPAVIGGVCQERKTKGKKAKK
jgi:hypothetical protein